MRLCAFSSNELRPGAHTKMTYGNPYFYNKVCIAVVLCCATRVFETIWFSSLGKNQTLLILAVLRGHNGLIWLAAKGALACLLLEHVIASSFAIQLLAVSKDDKPPKLLLIIIV